MYEICCFKDGNGCKLKRLGDISWKIKGKKMWINLQTDLLNTQFISSVPPCLECVSWMHFSSSNDLQIYAKRVNQCVEIFFYPTLHAPTLHPSAKEIQYMSGHCLDLSWNECLFWTSCIYQKTTLWMFRFSEVSGWEGSQLIKNCELVVGRPQ